MFCVDVSSLPCVLTAVVINSQENIEFFYAVQQFRASDADVQTRADAIMT